MRRVTVSLLSSALVAAGVISLASAAEPRRSIDVSRALDGGLPEAPPAPSVTPTPPDPPPLLEQHQWVFDLRWDRGDVFLLAVQPLDLPAPQPTPRVMGRFALEELEGTGPALVERVRFDFPLLGPPELDGGSALPSLASKLRTRIGVVFPATSRGTRLELVDRATGRRWSLSWPAKATAAPVSPLLAGDAGPVL